MKRFYELFKLIPIIAIASVAAMSKGHAAAVKKVTATPEGIIIKEIPKCEKQLQPKQCRTRVKAVFLES